ncbi:MAG TPA: hypothetical protein VH985_15670 [Candidatus Binatia bacterium]|jgi:hypothetical protein
MRQIGRSKLPQQAPLLSKEPSYVKNHPIYFSCELEEQILLYAIGLGLEKKIMDPSDYPHERPTLEEFLADIPRFRARKDLSDDIKKLILRDNCIDVYSLKLSKEVVDKARRQRRRSVQRIGYI